VEIQASDVNEPERGQFGYVLDQHIGPVYRTADRVEHGKVPQAYVHIIIRIGIVVGDDVAPVGTAAEVEPVQTVGYSIGEHNHVLGIPDVQTGLAIVDGVIVDVQSLRVLGLEPVQ